MTGNCNEITDSTCDKMCNMPPSRKALFWLQVQHKVLLNLFLVAGSDDLNRDKANAPLMQYWLKLYTARYTI